MMTKSLTTNMRHRGLARPHGFERPVSLSEVLDRVLNKGAVVAGEVVISVAGIDLIYLALNLVVTSVGKARHSKLEAQSGNDQC